MRTVDEVLSDPLPDGCAPHAVLSMIVVTEYLDDDGAVLLGWQRTSTDTCPVWRQVGMLQTVLDDLRHPTESDD